mmetsp:Transcript_11023/g.19926  ORF Transcript_11023/g.19926 Transcript_11023/m.19926 type:complete len:125 (+) Transcript_11023:640-1014(+)
MTHSAVLDSFRLGLDVEIESVHAEELSTISILEMPMNSYDFLFTLSMCASGIFVLIADFIPNFLTVLFFDDIYKADCMNHILPLHCQWTHTLRDRVVLVDSSATSQQISGSILVMCLTKQLTIL